MGSSTADSSSHVETFNYELPPSTVAKKLELGSNETSNNDYFLPIEYYNFYLGIYDTWNSNNNQVGIFVENSSDSAKRFVHKKYGAYDDMITTTPGIWFAKESNIEVTYGRSLNLYNGGNNNWGMSINSTTSALEFTHGDTMRMRILPGL